MSLKECLDLGVRRPRLVVVVVAVGVEPVLPLRAQPRVSGQGGQDAGDELEFA